MKRTPSRPILGFLLLGAAVAVSPPNVLGQACSFNAVPQGSLVHFGAEWCTMRAMKTQGKSVRQSVSLPAKTAAQVRNLAKSRRLSSNRMLVELIENGIEVEKRKQQEFFELAERFRNASDPEEVKRLGDELGRKVFGD